MKPVRVENLSKTYRAKRWKKVQALDDVSFCVESGEIFGFLGPNGAGKSTTIKILMGLIRPTSGQALLCDKPSTDILSRQHVGYLPENPALYDFLSGREYLEFVARAFRMSHAEVRSSSSAVLDRLALAQAAGRPIRSYSKGMVQRLGLAQALLHDPEVYVLDEPMSGLDPQGRALVKEIISDLGSRGKTVFFSTHITSDVEKICDRLAIVSQGRLQSLASVDAIRDSGIECYRILVKNLSQAVMPDVLSCSELQAGIFEYKVDIDKLVDLIESIKLSGGSIELVEPLRQDLEQFFLNVVSQAKT